MIWRIFYTYNIDGRHVTKYSEVLEGKKACDLVDRLRQSGKASRILCIRESEYQARKRNGLI